MRLTLTTLTVLSIISASSAFAQTSVTGQPVPDATTSEKSGGQKAVTRPNTDRPDAGNPATAGAASSAKLEEGASSFTEAQARKRLEDAGYKDVKELKKDDKGIWQGNAMLNGKPAKVGLDFKGNVAAQ
ncbi:MAG: PepSY domain-containing protein [Methylobacterium sp.]|uniref:PepSY domain-containing protein n=1 Tax=Methylobacterium sp. TaxID=409 RepID=UPI0025D44F4F|nr:PepSY domain-containing protein [Methylobacterium sp.]MBX9933016.1 PepSY domain-containing protein [Methylobacterium sp.]